MADLPIAGSTPPLNHFVVRGGVSPIPPAGESFSAAAGPDKADAGKGLPHNQIRSCRVEDIVRISGGTVVWQPVPTRSGTLNLRHVTVVEQGPTAFGDLERNPASKLDRIA